MALQQLHGTGHLQLALLTASPWIITFLGCLPPICAACVLGKGQCRGAHACGVMTDHFNLMSCLQPCCLARRACTLPCLTSPARPHLPCLTRPASPILSQFRWKWCYMVADEAHALKNRSSIRTRKLRKVAAACESRILLTGASGAALTSGSCAAAKAHAHA